MALVNIVVHVTRQDERADALLADVARRLNRGSLAPDESGRVFILFTDVDTADEAWELVHAALDASGEDWGDYLQLNPPR